MKRTVVTKDKQINIRIDGSDKVVIERAAKKAGLRPSAYIRESVIKRALGKLVEAT